MRYIIGVDGGRASTTAVVADESGCLLGVGHGGPSTRLHEQAGAERAQRAITDAIRGAISMADLENARITASCLGIHGSIDVLEAVCAPVVPSDCLIFGQESRIALYASTLGRPGVVVIGGACACAYGVNTQGDSASVGGWGHLLGDEGSGYWIALRALNACCRAIDGVGPSTAILPLLLSHLEAPDLHHICSRITACEMDTLEIAAIAEVTSRAAAQGDAAAKRIMRDAGKELALASLSVLRRLDMLDAPATVGAVGDVFRFGRLLLRSFREIVRGVAPQASITTARVPSAVGAAAMALEEIGVPLHDGIVANIELSLPRFGTLKM